MLITKFTAHTVEAFKNEFSEDFTVFNLLFEESDPEVGGQSWNFQRALGVDGKLSSLGEEDDGVCTVKEIQQVTIYEGIKSLKLSRNKLVCKFEENTFSKTNTSALEIDFTITDAAWKKLSEMAYFVFIDRDYFEIA